MKLPSFQFYPGDWLKDPNLQACSSAARGALINALCYAFESEQRGVLGTTMAPFSARKVAKLCGVSRRILNALLTAKVLKVARRSGAIFSARMVRDELLRRRRARFGRKGGASKTQAKGKQTTKQKAPPSSSSSSSSSPSGSTLPTVECAPPKKTAPTKDKKPRKANPIWDALVPLFFPSGVSTSDAKRLGAACRDLKAKNDVTPDEIRTRHAEVKAREWTTISIEGFVRDWDMLAPEAKPEPVDMERFYNPDGSLK